MKSFVSIIALAALSTITLGTAIPAISSPSDNTDNVHTKVLSGPCQKCTKAFIDCTKTCHGSQCQRICSSVHADGKPCKKTCGWP